MKANSADSKEMEKEDYTKGKNGDSAEATYGDDTPAEDAAESMPTDAQTHAAIPADYMGQFISKISCGMADGVFTVPPKNVVPSK
jgi:hypothetical protein